MQRGSQVLWAAGVMAAPAAILLGMLFLQLKRVDIINQDLDAELRLGRQRRERRTLEQQLEEAQGSAPEARAGATHESEG